MNRFLENQYETPKVSCLKLHKHSYNHYEKKKGDLTIEA